MMSYIRRCFVSGLLVWLPIWVTILAIEFLVDILDNSLTLLPRQYQPDQLFGVHLPGMGMIMTLLIIFFTGVIAANFIGSRLVDVWDSIINRIPIVRAVYSGVKQVAQTLFSPGGQSFRKVYIVEYPRAGVWTIAFQTGDAVKEASEAAGGQEMISLYVPTTPNPTSGFLLMLPRDKVVELSMSVEQALKFVISLGVVQPGNNSKGQKKIS